MHLRTALLLAIASLSLAAAVAALLSAQATDRAGIWAAGGQRLDQLPSTASRDFPAPNRSLTVRERESMLSLVAKNRVTSLEVPATPSLTEVLWSPDSSAFVINASDGGLVGTWDAYLFFVTADGRAASRDVRRLIEPEAKGVARCATDEVLNLGATAWLEGGKELLLVLEVPPHTSCRNPGALAGYRVSVNEWKILDRLSEAALRSRWNESLGLRFVK